MWNMGLYFYTNFTDYFFLFINICLLFTDLRKKDDKSHLFVAVELLMINLKESPEKIIEDV